MELHLRAVVAVVVEDVARGGGDDFALSEVERSFFAGYVDRDGSSAIDPRSVEGGIPASVRQDDATIPAIALHDGGLEDGGADHELVIDSAEGKCLCILKFVDEGAEDGVADFLLGDEEVVEVVAEFITQARVVAQDIDNVVVKDPRFLPHAALGGVVAEERKEEAALVPVDHELRGGVATEAAHVGGVEGNAGKGEVE